MREWLDLGTTTPPMEECAQVGSKSYDYYDRARKEARAYMNQIRRLLGNEPDGAHLTIKSHPHDFGSYLTVVCMFDDQDKAAAEYAARCDAQSPQEWDEIARRELELDLTERN
jgi:hypothetical protein